MLGVGDEDAVVSHQIAAQSETKAGVELPNDVASGKQLMAGVAQHEHSRWLIRRSPRGYCVAMDFVGEPVASISPSRCMTYPKRTSLRMLP